MRTSIAERFTVLTVLSPAKTLDYEIPSTTATSTTPRFMDQSALLVDDARKLAPDDIRSLMGCLLYTSDAADE